MAADAVGLMDALGIARAHVVGASMGGMIAQEVAIHWPERVRSLTSIMSTTGDPRLPPPTPEVMEVSPTRRPRPPEEYVEANVAAWLIFRGPGYPEDEKRDRARAMRAARRGFNPEGGQRQLLAVYASGSRKQTLPSVKAPTLVIHGADDPLVPLAAGEDTAAAIPGANSSCSRAWATPCRSRRGRGSSTRSSAWQAETPYARLAPGASGASNRACDLGTSETFSRPVLPDHLAENAGCRRRDQEKGFGLGCRRRAA